MWEQMDSLVRSGYTLQDLYTMPVYRRNFIVRLAIKRNEAENKASDASRGFQEGTPVSRKDQNSPMATVPGFFKNSLSAK